MTEYKTVGKIAAAEFVEKKSEFIGDIAPVTDEAAALDFIRAVRARHRTATHVVYAYVLRDQNIMRHSDDGEPSGTAGMPVLDVLRKSGVTDAVVTVTRYFGGILLGAGGLVRAYSRGAADALAAAGVVTMRECVKLELTFDYSHYTPVQRLLEGRPLRIDGTEFGTDVTLCLTLPEADRDGLIEELIELTAGGILYQELGREFAGL